MTPEITRALVAGLFGLIPVMVQIVSTRAQRRDRMSRLNQLRAELELLERLHTLQVQVSATDEAAKPQTNLVVRDSLSKVLEQYNELSKMAPPAGVGGRQPSTRQLSTLRSAFLLYNPHTAEGWVLHTLFYMTAFIFGYLLFFAIGVELQGIGSGWGIVILATPIGISLLSTQRKARRHAARAAAQLEEPNA